MTEVREARAAYDQARADARALVDRKRALLGQAIAEARENGTTQTEILKDMNRSREQIRSFEQAYKDWLRDHPGESLA